MERIHDHHSTRTTFLNVDDTKAGMGEVDKDKINRVIQEASKSTKTRPLLILTTLFVSLDSKFFKQQQRREEVERTSFQTRTRRRRSSLSRRIVVELK